MVRQYRYIDFQDRKEISTRYLNGDRVADIADCFDAMTARRPYKKPLSVSYAVSELKKNSGTQFDPELVNVFIRLINEGKITV